MANRQLFAIAIIVSVALTVIEARNFHAGNGPQRQWNVPSRQQAPVNAMPNPFLKRLQQMVFSPDVYQQPGLDRYTFGEGYPDEE